MVKADKKIKILLVDDEKDFRRTLTEELSLRGFSVTAQARAREALEKLARQEFDVALVDIRMPDMNGIDFVKEIQQKQYEIESVILTGYGSLENAIEAMKAGACDFLRKPCPLAEIEVAIQNAFEKKILKKQNMLLRQGLRQKDKVPTIIGKSAAIKKLNQLIRKVAPLNSTVLILGESGVGKELVARAIHQYSNRSDQPFIVMDCCSLSETLLQSELFGHEKGAFTGATRKKHGLFEVANHGTLLLDEIGEISPAIQAGLLRVLETGTFRHLGGVKDIRVDVRILASTNRNLEQAMNEGVFRNDLFYRLNVMTIEVPPLRQRKEDIPLLVEHHLKTSELPLAKTKRMSEEALKLLQNYDWPGNVRELFHVIEQAVILSESDVIRPIDIPIRGGKRLSLFDGLERELSLEELEREYIEWVLKKNDYSRKKTAQILKIDPKTLYRKLKNIQSKK